MSNPAPRPVPTYDVTLSQLALLIAVGQLGQSEVPKGSNKGPMIDKYLAAVKLNPGYAWCQAFVFWVYLQACDIIGIACPVVRTAGVLDCWNRTPADKKILIADARKNPGLIEPGYQIIFNYGKGAGHTGIVERVEGNIIHTIEGNSNSDGSREGYAVVRQQRRIDNNLIAGFIKY